MLFLKEIFEGLFIDFLLLKKFCDEIIVYVFMRMLNLSYDE